jgi:hypothetical protein
MTSRPWPNLLASMRPLPHQRDPAGDRMERRPHLVAEGRQKDVLGAVRLTGDARRRFGGLDKSVSRAVGFEYEVFDGFGEGLVDRLVETGHVLEVPDVGGRVTRTPQAEHRGTQRPVLRNHAAQGKPGRGGPSRARLTRRPGAGRAGLCLGPATSPIARSRSAASPCHGRLPAASARRRPAVPRSLVRRQGARCHARMLPLRQDGFHIRQNEVPEAHWTETVAAETAGQARLPAGTTSCRQSWMSLRGRPSSRNARVSLRPCSALPWLCWPAEA